MRVICIDDKPGVGNEVPPFKFGDIVNAEEVPSIVAQHLIHPELFYAISEYSCFPIFCVWFRKRFIPISEIDETEMERNYKKESDSVVY